MQLSTHLSKQFSRMGLQFFKKDKKVTHVSVARPNFLDVESEPVSGGVKKIMQFIDGTEECTRRQILEHLGGMEHVEPQEGEEPAPAPEQTEEQKQLFGIEKLNIKRSEIPAVTHVDYSARIQTVTQKNNKSYYDLIYKFKEKTGCPVVVNTSFNVRGEPIVNTPTDAFNCFMGTELDYLVIGNCILEKNKQDPNLKKDYTKEFELD